MCVPTPAREGRGGPYVGSGIVMGVGTCEGLGMGSGWLWNEYWFPFNLATQHHP